jgi:tellurite resistance protein
VTTTEAATAARHVEAAAQRHGQISLDLFAIPLGLAALGGTWTSARIAVDAPSIVVEVLFGVAAATWTIMTILYFFQLVRSRRGLADLRHPRLGPFAAYIPVIGILLATHYFDDGSAGFRIVVEIFVSMLALVAGWLLAHWVIGDVPLDALHPGYFLPVVAGPFVASIGLSAVGDTALAWAAFGVGTFFWLVVGSLILSRLITGGPLPEPARPAIVILMAPPAVAGLAWLSATHGQAGVVLEMIVGVLALLLLMQLALIPTYIKTRFSLGFWAFTFPICAAANLTVRLTSAYVRTGTVGLVWGALALASLAVLAIAIATLATRVASRRSQA